MYVQEDGGNKYYYKHIKETRRNVAFHRIVAESVLGKNLPPKAVIHHVDENGLNNKNDNLVICENSSFHNLLHARAKAINACGNPNFKRCYYCKQYDDPKNMTRHDKYRLIHLECNREKWKDWKLKQK